ncbi:MAG: gliding motility-associated-like protein, partial [Saprospiraceae bacterium]
DGAGTGGTYDWTPPTGLSDPTNATPSVSPLVSTRYYLTVTDANGCKDTSSVLISIIESIEYPDGVSPNGDGLNDTWPIIFIENFPDAIVEIYNRWGQMLFHSVGYQDRWDGTFDGKTLPVGTYYFVIDLGTDLPKYTGPITIFR